MFEEILKKQRSKAINIVAQQTPHAHMRSLPTSESRSPPAQCPPSPSVQVLSLISKHRRIRQNGASHLKYRRL